MPRWLENYFIELIALDAEWHFLVSFRQKLINFYRINGTLIQLSEQQEQRYAPIRRMANWRWN